MVQLTVDEGLVTREAVRSIYYTNYTSNRDQSSPPLVERLIPLGLKYRLTKVKNSFDTELAMFESERENLIRKHGVTVEREDENGNKTQLIEVPEDKRAEFFTDFNAYLTTMIDCEYNKLSKEDTDKLLAVLDAESIPISEIQMNLLGKYVFNE